MEHVEIEKHPLLKENEDLSKINLSEACIHILKGNIGPGMLSLPFAFSKIGPWWGPVLFLLIAFICVYNIDLLLSCKRLLRAGNIPNSTTFGDIGFHALGNSGRRVIDFFLIFTQFSKCCVYFTYIADNIHAVLPREWQVSLQTLILIIFPLLLLLSWIQSLHHITPYSAVATFAVLTGTCITIGYTIHSAPEHPTVPTIATFAHFAEFFGSTVYSLEGIALVLPIENALKTDCRFGFRRVLLHSMGFIVLLYLIVAELPLLRFGTVTDGSLTAMLAELYHSWLIDLVNLLLAFAVTFTFPLQFYPAIQVVEHEYSIVLRTSICTGLMIIAFLVPKVGLLISLVGAAGSSVLALIMPPLLYNQLISQNVFHYFIVMFGVLGLLIGTWSALEDIVTS